MIADPAAVARMLDAIRAGVPITAACQHAGISERAHFRAMAAGEAAEAAADAGETLDARADAYRQYRQQVTRARAEVAVSFVELVGQAARGGALVSETVRRYRDQETGETVVETSREFSRPEWKAAQFMLAASFREDFAPSTRRQVEHSGPDGGPIEHAGPADDALRTIADRLAEVAETQRRQVAGGWDHAEDRPRAIGPAVRADVVDLADRPEHGAELVAELVEDPQDGPR